MKKSRTLLALVFPGSTAEVRLRLLQNLLEIAAWLDTEIHVAIAREEQEAFRAEIERSWSSLQQLNQALIVHLIEKDPLRETLEILTELSMDYLVFEEIDLQTSDQELVRLRHSLLEQSPVPVLILPYDVPTQIPRTEALVVPMSGETHSCTALAYALRLAQNTDTSVTLLHVCEADGPCTCGPTGLESLGDELHHEYREMLDKIVSEGSPSSSLQERRRATRLIHRTGGAPDEISRYMQETVRSLLILEWKGVLVNGHAETVKSVLKSVHAPVLLVKESPQAASTLKLGKKAAA